MHYIFTLMLLFCSIAVQAQDIKADSIVIEPLDTVHIEQAALNPDLPFDEYTFKKAYKKTRYYKRFKALAISGYTLAGAGTIVYCIGGLRFVASMLTFDLTGDFYHSGHLVAAGALMIVAAAPLIVFAYINRHKAKESAKRIMLQGSNFQTYNLCGKPLRTPALTLSINI